MAFIAPSSTGPFADAYPLSAARLRHGLAAHPLLSLDALADAARELPPQHVERRVGDAGHGGDFAMDRDAGSDPGAAVRSAGDRGNWVMLRFIEQLPVYRDLISAVLDEVDPAISARTGQCRAIKGFVFISAPGALTPFHFDCEHNILFQIDGDKDFAVYPPTAPWLPPERHEAYHLTGENMLPWQDGFMADAAVHRLAPGDALFVPYAAPHWIRVGERPSISLSITWQSDWSLAAGDAMHLNPLLRRCGLPGAAMPDWPATPGWRATGARLARRMRLL